MEGEQRNKFNRKCYQKPVQYNVTTRYSNLKLNMTVLYLFYLIFSSNTRFHLNVKFLEFYTNRTDLNILRNWLEMQSGTIIRWDKNTFFPKQHFFTLIFFHQILFSNSFAFFLKTPARSWSSSEEKRLK